MDRDPVQEAAARGQRASLCNEFIGAARVLTNRLNFLWYAIYSFSKGRRVFALRMLRLALWAGI